MGKLYIFLLVIELHLVVCFVFGIGFGRVFLDVGFALGFYLV